MLRTGTASGAPATGAVDDSLYGKRDKRGDWKPSRRIEYPPVFVWPARPVAFLKWFFGFPGFLLPWNLLYAAAGVVLWLYLTPSPPSAA